MSEQQMLEATLDDLLEQKREIQKRYLAVCQEMRTIEREIRQVEKQRREIEGKGK